MFSGQSIPDLYCGGLAMNKNTQSYWYNNHNQCVVNTEFISESSIHLAWQLPSLRNDMRQHWRINGTRSDNIIAKCKRKRTVFTTNQINILEDMYKMNQYPTQENMQAIAEKVKLSDKPIRNWFRNRRLKRKRDAHQPTEQGQQEEICGSNGENVDVAVIHTTPVYEPVSPASVAENYEDDRILDWQPPDPYESLYYLFDLQTMFAL